MLLPGHKIRTVSGVGRRAAFCRAIGVEVKLINQHRFLASPKQIWFVEDSTAPANGIDVGSIQSSPIRDKLGDFWMLHRGILMIGLAAFDTFDPAQHTSTAAA